MTESFEHAEPAAALPAPPCRTLIVQNEDGPAQAMMRLVEAEGHAAIPTATVGGALRFLRIWSPQCVLLDPDLPDGDGLEVLRQIRRDGSDVRVAVLCAGADAAGAAREHRADACLGKPFDAGEMLRWLRAG